MTDTRYSDDNKLAFNLEAIYDAEIAPLMSKIIDICKEHKLPVFATFLYANDPETEETGLCTTNLMFDERPIPTQVSCLAGQIVRPIPALKLTVRNKDGQITKQTVILP